MLIDRTHVPWATFFAAVLAIASACYLIFVRGLFEIVPRRFGGIGGSIPGIVFGVSGFLMMVYAGLYGARKLVPVWRLGQAQTWLRGHIWIGLLSVPMMLFHSGFRWGGLVENVLWIVFAAVIVSGVVGLSLQQVLPRLMKLQLPTETFAEQLPYVLARSQFLMDKAVSDKCGPLKIENDRLVDICRKIVRFKSADEKSTAVDDFEKGWTSVLTEDEYSLFTRLYDFANDEGAAGGWKANKIADFPKNLSSIYASLQESSEPQTTAQGSPNIVRLMNIYLTDIRPYLANGISPRAALASLASAQVVLARERMSAPNDTISTIDKLQIACEQTRQYATQRRFYRWLHGWLLVHVPLSMALFVLAFAHIFNALRVIPLHL